MERKECCGNCRYHEKDLYDEGYICVNGESDYCADWTEYNDFCEEYEEE